MTREELDAALANPMPPRPAAPPTPIGFGFASEPEPPVEELAAERARRQMADHEAQRARVSAERAKLEPRLGETMKTSLRGARTPCALLLGPTGCGKTSGALYLAALAPYRVLLVRARDLTNADRRHPLGQGVPPDIERAQDARYLIVDDVGSEGSDPGAIQDLLDMRYSRGAAVIVTSGLTMPELTSHLGAAYVRRIVDQHVRRSDGAEFPVLVVDCHD